MGSIAPVGSAVLRDVVVPPTPLTKDHPGQGIPDGPCHDERDLPGGCYRVQFSLKIVAFITRSAPMSSALSMPSRSANLVRARLTRLLIVPIRAPQIAAASS